MNVELQAAELLEQGAKILERDGWMPWVLHDDVSGKRCVMGGLMAVAGLEPSRYVGMPWARENPVAVTAIARLASVIDPEDQGGNPDWNRVVTWNNMSTRTQQQVLDAVHVAAMSLRLQVAAMAPRERAEVPA